MRIIEKTFDGSGIKKYWCYISVQIRYILWIIIGSQGCFFENCTVENFKVQPWETKIFWLAKLIKDGLEGGLQIPLGNGTPETPVTDVVTKMFEDTEATSDEKPLQMMRHPRNSVLGASLALEGALPELTKEQINRASPILAQEFDYMRQKTIKECADVAEQKYREYREQNKEDPLSLRIIEGMRASNNIVIAIEKLL